MKAWPRVQPDEIIKVGWRTIVRKTFQNPEGKPVVYDTVGPIHGCMCAVVALTADNEVVIAKQFRPGPEQVMYELPGGFCDKGEDPLTTVKRELHKETGYTTSNIVYLGKAYDGAYQNMTGHYFIAYGCVPDGPAHTDGDGEHIEIELISVGQLFENARTAKMTDTGAVLLAYETLKELEQV